MLLRLLASMLASMLACATVVRAETPRFEIEVEGAAVWQARNDVQIPNDDTATRFAVDDLIGSGPVSAARANLRWNVNAKHQVHVLLAPFTFEDDGTPGTDLSFAGTDFVAGETATATYRFNSWRGGYRYRFHASERTDAWVGFTAKLRDAEVKLEQGPRSANDTDLGFVPLLHLAGRHFVSDTLSGSFELEGLAGGPGRAFDVALKLRYGRRDDWGVSLGYRTIEGGADVDAVYNFAWLNFAVIGVDVPLR